MTKDCKRSTTEKKKCEASHMEKSCNSKYSIAIPFNKKVNNFFYFLLFHCYFAVCCWFEFLPAVKMFAGRSVVPVNLARGQHITHFMQHLMEFRNFIDGNFIKTKSVQCIGGNKVVLVRITERNIVLCVASFIWLPIPWTIICISFDYRVCIHERLHSWAFAKHELQFRVKLAAIK